MKNFLKFIVLAPIALIVLCFAFANRHIVTVSFDPFADGDIAAFAITAPLFLIVVLSVGVGIVLGGFATWLSQGRYRRAARQSRAEATQLRAQQSSMMGAAPGSSALVPSAGLQRRI